MLTEVLTEVVTAVFTEVFTDVQFYSPLQGHQLLFGILFGPCGTLVILFALLVRPKPGGLRRFACLATVKSNLEANKFVVVLEAGN